MLLNLRRRIYITRYVHKAEQYFISRLFDVGRIVLPYNASHAAQPT